MMVIIEKQPNNVVTQQMVSKNNEDNKERAIYTVGFIFHHMGFSH